MRPDVHDFVVAFARRDDALAILLLDFLDLLLRGVNLLVAFLRHDHVVNADGRAGFRRLAETQLLQFVEHRPRSSRDRRTCSISRSNRRVRIF